jgi:RHS repeat-associated protein
MVGQSRLVVACAALLFISSIASGQGLLNGGFESPAQVQGSASVPLPASSNWSLIAAAGANAVLVTNGLMTANGLPPSVEGSQMAMYTSNGGIHQSTTLPAGTYTLSFNVMGNGSNPGVVATASVNNTQIGGIALLDWKWRTYTTPPFTISSSGTFPIDFKTANPGLWGYVYIDNARIDRVSGPVLSSFGFETPARPQGEAPIPIPPESGWAPLGYPNTALITNSYMVANGLPPGLEGVQIGMYTSASGLRQTLSLPAGTYSVSFDVMGNANNPGVVATVKVNNSQVGSVALPSWKWKTYTTDAFTLSAAGNYNIDFGVADPNLWGYVYIDNVRISDATIQDIGPGVSFSATVPFPSTLYGTLAYPQYIAITNTGYSPLTVSGYSPSGSDYFVYSDGCTATIAPRAQCYFLVGFTPAAIGTRSDFVEVTSNAPGVAPQVQFSGTGTGMTFYGSPIDDVNAGGAGGDGSATFIAGALEPTTPIPSEAAGKLGSGGPTSVIGTEPTDDPNPVPLETIHIWGTPLPSYAGGGGGGSAAHASPQNPNEDKTNDCFGDGDSGENEHTGPAKTMLALAGDESALSALRGSEYVLDPIHAGTGNKHHRQVDYVANSVFRLAAVRTYNSVPFESSRMARQSLGPGWTSNWDRSVMASGGVARVSRGDGKSFSFSYNGTTTWTANNSWAKLEQVAPGWRYTTKDGVVENYDANGRLLSVVLLTGHIYTFSYDLNGRLASIVSPTGASLQYSYDYNGRLIMLTDPAGGQINYGYDSRRRLGSVTYPDGRVRQYRYENPNFAFALTSIIDEAGQTFVTFAYDSLGRAVSNVFAGNVGAGSVAYSSSSPGSSTTTPDSTVWARSFVVNNGKIQMTGLTPTCSDCGTGSEAFGYDAQGKLQSYTNRAGQVTTYSYNTRGLAEQITGPQPVTIAWHPTLRLPTQISNPAAITSYQYDSSGRMTQKTISAGGVSRTTTYSYNAEGLLSQVDGPRTDVSDITSYTYDAAGNVSTITNAKGQVTSYTSYDAHGRALAVTYPNGTTGTFSYDSRGRPTSQTVAGQTTTSTYNEFGALSTVTDYAGVVTTYLYDSAHRLIGIDKLGEKTRYTLDNSGRAIRTDVFDATNYLVSTSSTVYDGLGRIRQTVGAGGQVTQYSYDAVGNLTQTTDPNGYATNSYYDSLNRPYLVRDPLSQSVTTTYNSDNSVASIRDPNNNSTTFGYNGFGDNTQIVSPDTGTTTMTMGLTGKVVTKVDARGATATYTYDALDRLVQMTRSDGTGITKTYDVATNGVGQLAQVTDPSGTTSYTYDAYGRTQSRMQIVGGVSRTVSFARDPAGQISTIIYPSGKVLGITYANNRITSLTFDGQSVISGAQYFPFGGVESWIFGNAKEYTRYIDRDGRVARYLTASGERRITLDPGSRITRIDDVAGATTKSQSFGYDASGRLTTFAGFTSAAASESQSFAYDLNGNRLSATLNGTAQTYNYVAGTNRLTSVTQGGATVIANTFDNAGNTISDGLRGFTYDGGGRMVQSVSGGVSTTYTYNADGQRLRKSNSSQTRVFVYDDAGHMLGEYDGSGAVVQELIWLEDTPVAVVTGTAIGYIWTDHLNTPREITNSANLSIWKWDSLPFGNTDPDSNPSGIGAFTFNHRFPGQYFDAETGLHQNWNRDYVSTLGRYLQSDPLGLKYGTNPYIYAKQDPLSRKDPTGRDPMMNCAMGGYCTNGMLQCWDKPETCTDFTVITPAQEFGACLGNCLGDALIRGTVTTAVVQSVGEAIARYGSVTLARGAMVGSLLFQCSPLGKAIKTAVEAGHASYCLGLCNKGR